MIILLITHSRLLDVFGMNCRVVSRIVDVGGSVEAVACMLLMSMLAPSHRFSSRLGASTFGCEVKKI